MLLRRLERATEKALTLLYNERDHERHYRRVMGSRALFRRFRGLALTNTPDAGWPIFEQLARIAEFDGSQSVLDYGCGEAGVGVHFAKALTTGSYVGVDISPPAIETAKARLGGNERASTCLIEHADDVDGSFDLMVAQSVFTHCPLNVFSDFLEMARRTMKPGGKALVNFAVSETESRIARTDYVFTRDQIEACAKAGGFSCVASEAWQHPAQSKRLADAPRDTLFILTR